MVLVAAFAATIALPEPGTAQSADDLRALHEQAVYATVRIEATGGAGSGWLLAQSGRPLVVTNAHVARLVPSRGRARVYFYAGSEAAAVEVAASRMYLSDRIDLGILRLEADPPATARPVVLRTDATVTRGERVVLGGNPVDRGSIRLPFQTTEGVVTGHVSGNAYDQCGEGRNCVVVDAASFRGSSGGPALNVRGQLVGMLWGGPTQVAPTATTRDVGVAVVQNPAFSYLIHVRTIADELQRLQHR